MVIAHLVNVVNRYAFNDRSVITKLFNLLDL